MTMQSGVPASRGCSMGERHHPFVHHQGRLFPSQSRKAPELSCERLASTVRMPLTLCSTVSSACRKGQWAVTEQLLGREHAQEQHPCCSWGYFSLLPHLCSPAWVGDAGLATISTYSVCCSLLPAPCLLCSRRWSWQPTASHKIPQVPLLSPRHGDLVGLLLTLPCTAQYLLCAHVSLHPARMDGHTQDPLVLEFHSQAPRHHVLGSLEEAQPCQHNWGSGWAGEGTFPIYKMSVEMGNGT